MVGRPAVPREVKKAKGTLQKCRDKKTLTLTEISEIHVPEYFTERQKNLYILICTELKNAKVLATVDNDLIFILVNEYETYFTASDKTKGENAIVINHLGNEMMSPWVTVKNTAIGNIMKMVSHLGLSPAARARIKMGAIKEDDKPKDPAAKLIGLIGK